jgi:glycosyltransferase involved in cell wall biosynthesis
MQGAVWKPISAASVRIESILENAVITRATAVVCVTERHTATLRQQYPHVLPDRFVTIPNGYDEAEFPPLGTPSIIRNRVFTITYTGELYQRRNPRPLFRALRRLLDLGIIAPGTARFDLIGQCDMAEGKPVQDMVVQHGLTGYVTLLGPLDKTSVLRHVLASDLLLVLAEGWTMQIPIKAYEYLRSGRAILALTSEGALADLLRVTGGARVIDPTDDAGIVDAVASAYGAWKRGVASLTADPHVVATFDRRALSGRFASLFDAASSASQR